MCLTAHTCVGGNRARQRLGTKTWVEIRERADRPFTHAIPFALQENVIYASKASLSVARSDFWWEASGAGVRQECDQLPYGVKVRSRSEAGTICHTADFTNGTVVSFENFLGLDSPTSTKQPVPASVVEMFQNSFCAIGGRSAVQATLASYPHGRIHIVLA